MGSLFIHELGINDISGTFINLDVYAIEALLLVTALVLLVRRMAV